MTSNERIDIEVEEEEQTASKIELLDPVGFAADPSNLTVILHEEDHTIGNALKHLLCQNPEVEFCGYNVPHPLEDKILLRIQTKIGSNALPFLVKALEDLEKIFATMRGKFAAVYRHSSNC
ncbi:unnamed protein product [Caenorhabditis auriculariae]|uniref:DNA-directed RNA polymerase I subunit D n=1 Tax=Caenorhabditis auriculariae TaxID=2777116 RepID=A0A8S1GSI5_9PELO|nr:unnamed protein product [Caenorhabditis auriculariae]